MKHTIHYLLAISLATLCCHAAPAAEIQLLSQSHPKGNVVLLGDVAEIHSSDATQAERLSQLELFPVPATGSRRYLRLREIQDLLERRGTSLSSHAFSGASVVLVSATEPAEAAAIPQRQLTVVERNRAGQLVESSIVKYLEQHASALEQWNVEVALSEEQVRQLESATVADIGGGQAPWTGPQRFQLLVNDAKIEVEALVTVQPAVVVAVRSLPRGATVGPSDVRLDRDSMSAGTGQRITRLEDVIGLETTQAIAAGKPLDRSEIRQPLVVRRGDVVTVFARSAGVQVKAQGRARDDGSLGDVIEIESLMDRKRYLARVSGIQEAEIYARAASAAADDASEPQSRKEQ